MALLKTKPRRQPQQPRRGHLPPLPHPSWRIGAVVPGGGGAGQIVQARDFWDRLGI
ncbi:hypothetical protein [Sphingobium nicotianae]|uniref:Uncharacterized protein n=1 Tax=Sphingobium nicotianae TaxID=2782607 RepID=A0A9X1D836_9SPHN|nr:hypothetical protein [Sphingobium nicotianae]MBT2185867.1 hypothetical protein [Sphingobium nicotianae]